MVLIHPYKNKRSIILHLTSSECGYRLGKNHFNIFYIFKDDRTVLRHHENDFLQSQDYDSDNDKENISPTEKNGSPQQPATPMVNQKERCRR